MFRNEMVTARRSRWLGEVLLAQPLSARLGALAAALAASAVIALMALGTYTSRVTVVGRLVPASGIAKIYATQRGVVTARLVSEGQPVRRGDVLYVVSSDYRQRTGAGVHASVTGHIAERVRLLKADIREMERSHLLATQAQQAAVDACMEEIVKLDSLIRNQHRRVAIAQQNKARYARLLAQTYVSDERAQEKHAEYLEQSARESSLQRERVQAVRALSAEKQKLASMPLNQHRELMRSLRELANVEQELAENEGKREFSVVSPVDGTATAVVAEAGQHVATTAPVVSILPNGAPLEAHLYVRSSAVGFIKTGDRVRLRYRAFAYQKFGHFTGNVISVSNVTLPHTDVADIDPYEGRYGSRVPVYLVKVRIANSASTPQEELPLRAGMMLDADLMRETRQLYQWALYPLSGIGRGI